MSYVARGTLYEQAIEHMLSAAPFNMTLVRSAGRNDRGIDIMGWDAQRKTRILVQCKAKTRAAQPVLVRELLGTLAERRSRPCLGILASTSGYSLQAAEDVMNSKERIMLLHVDTALTDLASAKRDMKLHSAVLSGGARAVLSPDILDYLSPRKSISSL